MRASDSYSRKRLGAQDKEGAWVAWLLAAAVSDPVTREEEDGAADMWGWAISERRDGMAQAWRDWAECWAPCFACRAMKQGERAAQERKRGRLGLRRGERADWASRPRMRRERVFLFLF